MMIPTFGAIHVFTFSNERPCCVAFQCMNRKFSMDANAFYQIRHSFQHSALSLAPMCLMSFPSRKIRMRDNNSSPLLHVISLFMTEIGITADCNTEM